MLARACALLLAALLAACGGGGRGGNGAAPTPGVTPASAILTRADVQRIVAQAVGEAQARGVRAQVVVVDRVGNVLATFEMTGAVQALEIRSTLGVSGGLEGLKPTGPYAAYSAIAKAVTGAYLSSNGNAFTTRTAGQIIQEHFNPQEAGQPSGPLYGVQFSQLRCSDVIRTVFSASLGPKPSPFGLSGDPGGLPLYKDGVLVGGIGVEADGRYGFDRDITDQDENVEEAIAVAGSFGFSAPGDIRANRITADGRTFRFVDTESLASDPARAPTFESLPGRLAIALGFTGTTLRDGTAFGSAESGVAPVAGGAWTLVDGNGRPLNVAHADLARGLAAADVQAILDEALALARRTRAQIRRPLGSAAEVSVAVVGRDGDIVGLARSPDAPIFGIDVAVQKARTASFFSGDGVVEMLGGDVDLARYLVDARAFLGDSGAFTGATAWSVRAIGNLHRPTFPDGIDGTVNGPFSTPMARWSPLNPGLQLDLIFPQFAQAALNVAEQKNCASPGALPNPTIPRTFRLLNGLQIFPGGVPIYREGRLVGAVGVSGDGVDQDDMIAFLGLHNAGVRLANGIGNAPPERRADRLTPQGTRLRYVQCPQSPFLDSSEQNVCAGK